METKSLLNEGLIVRYLLGDLPEEEQARLEERAFADRRCTEDIVAVEGDLIDEYVRGGLSNAERRLFEQRFLASAERRQKVEFARALAQVASASAAEAAAQPATIHWWEAVIAFLRGSNPAFQFSMAASALILVLGVSWLIVETSRLRAQVAQLQAKQQAEQQTRQQQEEALRQQAASASARSEDLAVQLERERERREELARQIERDQSRESSAGASFIASLFLPPGIGRSGAERPKLMVPQSARLARLQIGLEREDEFKSFRVEIRTAQGQEVWTQDHLRPRQSRAGRVINLTIPGNTLSPGQYELTLKGVIDPQNTEDVRYYWRTFETTKGIG
ncbi:MAG: hypothetical protein ABI977_11890, partial [Acidobacteriota bacterium]